MEKRSHRCIRDLVAQPAFPGLDANEIGCVRISIMAGSNARRSGTVQGYLPTTAPSAAEHGDARISVKLQQLRTHSGSKSLSGHAHVCDLSAGVCGRSVPWDWGVFVGSISLATKAPRAQHDQQASPTLRRFGGAIFLISPRVFRFRGVGNRLQAAGSLRMPISKDVK
jgi:hypothetical protein